MAYSHCPGVACNSPTERATRGLARCRRSCVSTVRFFDIHPIFHIEQRLVDQGQAVISGYPRAPLIRHRTRHPQTKIRSAPARAEDLGQHAPVDNRLDPPCGGFLGDATGGPWPSTTSVGHTSVGATAIRRWVRPVCHQSLPDHLLPAPLRTGNPWRIPRRMNGSCSQYAG